MQIFISALKVIFTDEDSWPVLSRNLIIFVPEEYKQLAFLEDLITFFSFFADLYYLTAIKLLPLMVDVKIFKSVSTQRYRKVQLRHLTLRCGV